MNDIAEDSESRDAQSWASIPCGAQMRIRTIGKALRIPKDE
jgi:hypothetical protein